MFSIEVLEGFRDSTDLIIRENNLRLSEGGESKTNVYHKTTLGAEILASEIPGDFDGDGQVRFNDFFLFADGFGTTDPKYDLNDSGLVDFDDFFIFADNFGKTESAKLITLAEHMIGLPRETARRQRFDTVYPRLVIS